MAANDVDALVIFGATGDLAKIETFQHVSGQSFIVDFTI